MSVHTEMRARETWLTPARIAWIVFALTLAVFQIASQFALWREMQNINLTPPQIQSLQAMGLSQEFLALWRFMWQIPWRSFGAGLDY